MAENKRSFVLYVDQIHIFKGLDDDEAGRLIKHIFEYVNDLNPTAPDKLTKIAFEPIKQQLKRDLIKYWGKQKQWSDAGKASAEAKRLAKEAEDKTVITDSTSVENVERMPTDSTVNVIVNDNDNVIVNEIHNTVYIKIKGEKLFLKPSDWLKANKETAIDEYMAGRTKISTESIFAKLNSDYSNYDFKDHNHLFNCFKISHEKLLKESLNGKKPTPLSRTQQILTSNKELKDEIDREYGNK